MTKYQYDATSAVVFDPVVANRNATRTSMNQLGFRKVDVTATMEALATFLSANSPDLLIVEVTGLESEICGFVQSIRRGELGANPFIVVIATTWRRDGTIISKVINSGADDLVARPLSTRVLGERIKLQIDRRKGFVVTYDYIGPDRRRDMSRQGGNCMEVPNTLKERATNTLPPAEVERKIASAIRDVKEQLSARMLARDVVQLGYQWRSLERTAPGSHEFFDHVERMDRLVPAIRGRIEPADSKDAGDCCADIARAAAAILGLKGTTGQEAYAPHLRRLSVATARLGQIYAPSEGERAHRDPHSPPDSAYVIEAA